MQRRTSYSFAHTPKSGVVIGPAIIDFVSRARWQWFGHYSFGHQGGRWTNNEVNDNFGYGFDPHDDSDFVEISGNKVRAGAVPQK